MPFLGDMLVPWRVPTLGDPCDPGFPALSSMIHLFGTSMAGDTNVMADWLVVKVGAALSHVPSIGSEIKVSKGPYLGETNG